MVHFPLQTVKIHLSMGIFVKKKAGRRRRGPRNAKQGGSRTMPTLAVAAPPAAAGLHVYLSE